MITNILHEDYDTCPFCEQKGIISTVEDLHELAIYGDFRDFMDGKAEWYRTWPVYSLYHHCANCYEMSCNPVLGRQHDVVVKNARKLVKIAEEKGVKQADDCKWLVDLNTGQLIGFKQADKKAALSKLGEAVSRGIEPRMFYKEIKWCKKVYGEYETYAALYDIFRGNRCYTRPDYSKDD